MSTPTQERKPPSDLEIREYFLLLQEDPRSRIFAPLAQALLARGRTEDAVKICAHGLKYNPEFSDGHLIQARVLASLFRHQEAMQAIKRTLALDAHNVDAYLLAAEIYLTCAQTKVAAETCMRVLDLEPGNERAMALLQQTRGGAVAGPQAGPEPAPAQQFRQTAGTAPSRRQGAPAVANPFDQLLQQLESEATGRIEEQAQPFTALSAGSQSGIGPADEAAGEDFDVPTARSDFKAPAVPRLPERPPTPAEQLAAAASQETDDRGRRPEDLNQDLLSQVPAGPGPVSSSVPPHPDRSQAPAGSPAPPVEPAPKPLASTVPQSPPATAASPGPPDSTLAEVAQVQAIIDLYRERLPRDEDPDALPLRVPRLGSALSLLLPLLLMAGVVLLIVYLVPSGEKRIPAADQTAADAGPIRTPARPAAPGPLPPADTAPAPIAPPAEALDEALDAADDAQPPAPGADGGTEAQADSQEAPAPAEEDGLAAPAQIEPEKPKERPTKRRPQKKRSKRTRRPAGRRPR